MANIDVPGTVAVVGSAAITTGIWGLVGWQWACIAAGILAIVWALLTTAYDDGAGEAT